MKPGTGEAGVVVAAPPVVPDAEDDREGRELFLPTDLRHRLQQSFEPRIRGKLLARISFSRLSERLGRTGAVPVPPEHAFPRDHRRTRDRVASVRADGTRVAARRSAFRAVETVARSSSVDRILLTGTRAGEVRPMLRQAAHISGCALFETVAVSLDGRGATGRSVTTCVQGSPPIWQFAAKRLVDVLGAVVGLIVLAPFLALIAAGVKLSSPGPVLFRQRRVGMGGREFRIFKFRTMRTDSERKVLDLQARSVYPDRRLFKVPDDPRVTWFGRLLRRTSLDELPQLFNVLRGEMSLVGPRPPLPEEVAQYDAEHHSRFDRKPGVTGPWQVSGRNRITDFEKIVRLERDYTENWTLWKDAVILLKTLPAVIRGDGASERRSSYI